MFIKKLSLALALIGVSISAHAATSPAEVDLYGNLGAGSIYFTGPAAAKVYKELNVPVDQLNATTREKVGKNIGCSERRTGRTKVYYCGSVFVTATGESEPIRVSVPFPGVSVGN